MENDVKGCSTTTPGTEVFEKFQTKVNGRYQNFYQYDYRHTNGGLFSCVKPTLAQCRAARDKQLTLGNIN